MSSQVFIRRSCSRRTLLARILDADRKSSSKPALIQSAGVFSYFLVCLVLHFRIFRLDEKSPQESITYDNNKKNPR
ncbi:hypothetical protein PUN28_002225 [Cardiocondyla obscurior]|uniref:Uncharacterized protein n=1 Tax=Cardiocondyla obscurior TaxID=286306 RepID=A0AAW2GT32_9HYME